MSEEVCHNMTVEQMSFAVFCIGAVADRLGMREEYIFNLFEKTGVLKNYIIDLYDVLHTQSQEYIVDDIIDYMKIKGIIE
ncbi:MAG: DUF3791 domain-containing protein [Bacteroidales bacterium]|nr:DUF3791 domain-containing protein [Bacteroidales bacterium]